MWKDLSNFIFIYPRKESWNSHSITFTAKNSRFYRRKLPAADEFVGEYQQHIYGTSCVVVLLQIKKNRGKLRGKM